MATIPTASSLFRRAGVRRVPGQPDPADMGTAFGMEASIDQARAAAAARLPGRTAAGEPRGWWSRLMRR